MAETIYNPTTGQYEQALEAPNPEELAPPPLLSERGLGDSSREQQQQMAQGNQQGYVAPPSDWASRWIEMQMGGYSISGRDRVKGRNYGKGKGGKDMTEKDAFTHWSGKLAGMTPEQREVIRRRMEGLDTQTPQGQARDKAFRDQQTGTPSISRNGVSAPGSGSSAGSSSAGSGGQSPKENMASGGAQVPSLSDRRDGQKVDLFTTNEWNPETGDSPLMEHWRKTRGPRESYKQFMVAGAPMENRIINNGFSPEEWEKATWGQRGRMPLGKEKAVNLSADGSSGMISGADAGVFARTPSSSPSPQTEPQASPVEGHPTNDPAYQQAITDDLRRKPSPSEMQWKGPGQRGFDTIRSDNPRYRSETKAGPSGAAPGSATNDPAYQRAIIADLKRRPEPGEMVKKKGERGFDTVRSDNPRFRDESDGFGQHGGWVNPDGSRSVIINPEHLPRDKKGDIIGPGYYTGGVPSKSPVPSLAQRGKAASPSAPQPIAVSKESRPSFGDIPAAKPAQPAKPIVSEADVASTKALQVKMNQPLPTIDKTAKAKEIKAGLDLADRQSKDAALAKGAKETAARLEAHPFPKAPEAPELIGDRNKAMAFVPGSANVNASRVAKYAKDSTQWGADLEATRNKRFPDQAQPPTAIPQPSATPSLAERAGQTVGSTLADITTPLSERVPKVAQSYGEIGSAFKPVGKTAGKVNTTLEKTFFGTGTEPDVFKQASAKATKAAKRGALEFAQGAVGSIAAARNQKRKS